jgi:hypothetical protein
MPGTWRTVLQIAITGERIIVTKRGKEPIENIRHVCGRHYRTGAYAGHSPESFSGKLVKLGFHFTGTNRELMWVTVKGVADSGQCIGTLCNDPHYVDYLENGDEVYFDPTDVLDVQMQ